MTSFLFLSIAILIFSIVIHEVAHGWVADKLGDPTAKLQGRLTLNPLPHIDPIGSLLIPGILIASGSSILFGWAKPVPYNPYNLQGKFAELKVAIAGPIANIILAIMFGVLIRVNLFTELNELFIYGVLINCALAIFNLVPIPPLDGSKILFELLPSQYQKLRQQLEQFGPIVLLAFIFFGFQLIAPLIYGLGQLIIG
jgi:Zn-dependent protease